MADFVDLILVQDGPRPPVIFYAPFASGLKVGDLVRVEIDELTHCNCRVIEVLGVMINSDTYRLAKSLAGDLKRVIGKFEPLDYSNEDYIKENKNV